MRSSYRKSFVVRQPNAAGMGCMRVFFGIFFLAGMATLYFVTIRPMFQAAVALRWEETPCIVDSSRVVVVPSSGRGGPTYRIEVVYHYTFHGSRNSSRRYQFSSGSSSGRDRKQRIVDQYPPERQTVCYVNPGAPSEAVLYRGLNVEMAFGCFGLIFAGVGWFGLFGLPKFMAQQKASQKDAVPKFAPATGEPMVLKPQITALGKFFLTLGFGIVWNGMMSVFFYFVFLSPNHHNEPLFAKIFVGLFTFIGVLIIGAIFGAFLALFNPRVEITARTNAVCLGREFQFHWSIRGRVEKLRKLRFTLEGREEVSYHSGESLQTATQVFAEIPVFETADREMISQGQARVVVPANLMHTFTGAYNRIVWRLRVWGEIAHLAPLDQEHTLNVLPHGTAT